MKYRRIYDGQKRRLTEDEVRTALFLALNYDPRRAFDENERLLPIKEWPDDLVFAVASFEQKEIFDGQGNFTGYLKKVRFIDRAAVINTAMRHMGLLQDRVAITDARNPAALSDAELDAERSELDAQREAVAARKGALGARVPARPLKLVSGGAE